MLYRKLKLYTLLKSRICLSILSFFLGYCFKCFTSYEKSSTKVTIENELSLDVKHYSGEELLLIILIFSSVNNFSKRQTIRETWLSNIQMNQNVKYYFVISQGGLVDFQNTLILAEQEKNNDLLILPELEDSFHLLTAKLLESFVRVAGIDVSQNKKQHQTTEIANNFKYLLKCDDDSFVRVEEIVKELEYFYSGLNGKNLYWGFFDGRAKVKKTGKYKEEDWNICDNYIPYAVGGGYVLGKSLVFFIAQNKNYLKKYRNEDVSVGAWLSSFDGINRVHDPRFDTEYISRGCNQNYLITHKHSETAMRNFHYNLKNFGVLCRKEFKTRISYIYNWQAPPSNCCARVNPSIP